MSVRLPKTFHTGTYLGRVPFGPDVNKPVRKGPLNRYPKLHAAAGGIDAWHAEWDRLVAKHGNPISREGYLPVLKEWSAFVKRTEKGLREPSKNGDARKAEGMARVSTGDDRERWLHDAIAFIEAQRPGTALTADDVRSAIGGPPHPNLVGAAVNTAARAGLIELDGYTTATRPERHSSVLRRWVRTEAK